MRQNSKRLFSVLLLVGALASPLVAAGGAGGASGGTGAVPGWSTSSRGLGLLTEDIVPTDDGARFARTRTSRGGSVVEVDGRSGPDFEEIRAGSVVFSHDGKRLAYEARKGSKWYAVFDQQPGSGFDQVSLVQFSDDGRRTAFMAQLGGKWLAVVDGKVQAQRFDDGVADGLVFDPGGRHVAFAGVLKEKWFVVTCPLKTGRI